MQKVLGRLRGWLPRVPPPARRGLSSAGGGEALEGGEVLGSLPEPLRRFVEEGVQLCRPRALHVCDGSPEEGAALLAQLQADGLLHPLPKYENCWLARTDPRDVARVESRTVLVTERERDSVPAGGGGGPSRLANWMSPAALERAVQERFPGCMAGRTLYVIPFSMGPLGSPLAKVGVQLTDSPYVVASMRIMTRVGPPHLFPALQTDDFVRCLHSVGCPLPLREPLVNQWPCDPARTLVAHEPDRRRIVSFGSGYGGNSLLGKKCFALRIASRLARDEGWLAEHMLILGVTDPAGRKRYMAAAFPSACGKTNLAMMAPALPGWRVTCVGDDIAWMRFDDEGRLRAINPECGFFGVAPGTSRRTNPAAMATIARNTLFTNVGRTSEGGAYWEGLDEDTPPGTTFTSWLGQPWRPGDPQPCAHPNSRFCAPAAQCPVMDPAWEDPEGVPIDAIIFGGRRPEGVPLVYEALSWRHGVFVGSTMRSEATAAAEHTGTRLLHDPFAMRPFFGYNAGQYLAHWLGLAEGRGRRLPRIFHVNWFLRRPPPTPPTSEGGGSPTSEGGSPTSEGGGSPPAGWGPYLWPGFGHNIRVLAWICGRLAGRPTAAPHPAGLVPREGALELGGLPGVRHRELFGAPRPFWEREVRDLRHFYRESLGGDLPPELWGELRELEGRVRRL